MNFLKEDELSLSSGIREVLALKIYIEIGLKIARMNLEENES